MKAVTVIDELNKFLFDKLKEICKEKQIDAEFDFHSNVLPDTSNQKLRIYFNRRIIREEQDTLAVDVEDLGKVRYTSEGVYAINFFMARSIPNGYSKMEQIAQELKNALRQKRFDCLWVRHVTASPYNMENNSYRYDITFSYEFDEIV